VACPAGYFVAGGGRLPPGAAVKLGAAPVGRRAKLSARSCAHGRAALMANAAEGNSDNLVSLCSQISRT
jgi:hypothetical protein